VTKASEPETVRGKIVSVNNENGTFIVKPREGSDITITTDGSTKVTIDGMDAKLVDVKADMFVEVALAGGVARKITAYTSDPHDLRGTILSVDAAKGTLVVKPAEGDNVTVTTNADTKVTLDGKDAKLADLKAGMMVGIMPATGVAKMIHARSGPANP
jgi:ribosomal protein L6P/L9E